MRRALRTMVRPFTWLFDRLAFIIFSQRDPAAKKPGWTPGGGGRGGAGGQVPPYVPYNPDHDPDRKIP